MEIKENFKKICTRAGLALILIVIFRIVTDLAVILLSTVLKGTDPTFSYVITTFASLLILYVGCILATAFTLGFKKEDAKGFYKKGARFAKAVSWVVPAYGAGQFINFAVLAISFLLLGNDNAVQQTFAPITSGPDTPSTAVVIVLTVFQLSVCAPLFEEFWFRGIIQTKLTPYGNGFAILVSALAFGFAHGNLHQFCYTFAIGIVLGYVRYATGSLAATTVIHCILNSVAAVILVLASCDPVMSAMEKIQNGEATTGFESAMMTTLGVTMLVVFILMIAGVFTAFGKLKQNRLYRPVNNCTELTRNEKWGIFKNPVFIIGTVICIAYIVAMIFI